MIRPSSLDPTIIFLSHRNACTGSAQLLSWIFNKAKVPRQVGRLRLDGIVSAKKNAPRKIGASNQFAK
jgi:hypothetical protein